MKVIDIWIHTACFLTFVQPRTCQEDADKTMVMFQRIIRDRYGDTVAVPYQGGSITLLCILMSEPNVKCEEPFGEISLMRTDKNGQHTKVHSGPASCKTPNVEFTLAVEAEFGTYWCKRRNEKSTETMLFRHRYYLCNNKDCKIAECQSHYSVCVVTEGASSQQSCSKPEKSTCAHRETNIPRKKIFPAMSENLCTAMATDVYQDAWGEWYIEVPPSALTEPRNSWPRLNYDETIIRVMEPILVQERDSNYIRIEYENSAEMGQRHLQCRFRNIFGKVIDEFKDLSLPPSKTISVTLNETVFRNGSKAYKLQCLLKPSTESLGTNEMRLDAILVNIGGQLEITGQQKQQDAFVNKMTCRLTPEPTDEFSVPLYFWTKQGGDGAPMLGNHLTLNADAESGEYLCHANVTYSSCSPPRRFVRTIDSEVVRAVFRATTTTTTTKAITKTSTTTSTTNSSSSASSTKIITTTTFGIITFGATIYNSPGTSTQPSGPPTTTAAGPTHDGAETIPIWNCHFVMLMVIGFGLVINNAM